MAAKEPKSDLTLSEDQVKFLLAYVKLTGAKVELDAIAKECGISRTNANTKLVRMRQRINKVFPDSATPGDEEVEAPATPSTPKSRKRKPAAEADDAEQPSPKTPKTPKSPKGQKTPKEPKSPKAAKKSAPTKHEKKNDEADEDVEMEDAREKPKDFTKSPSPKKTQAKEEDEGVD